MRCGITEVNHEPGPRITQSASRTAATVSGADGGSCGLEGDAQHGAPGGGHRDLAAQRRDGLGVGRVEARAPAR